MKILIVDDNIDNARMGADVIRMSGHEAVMAMDGYEALDILSTENIQLAIVDWMMPEMDGIELVQRIRAQFSERYIYIIMLTAKGTQDDIEQGLENGADDYVVKPFPPREMRARINTGTRIIEMTSRLSNSLEQMENLATRDHLTKLYNRRRFLEIAQKHLQEQSVCTLLMLDIDHFKQVNDNHGHLAGDKVLQQVAALCTAQVEGMGVIGRYGGEEFIGILPGLDMSHGELFAEALRQTIEQTPMKHDGGALKVTVSIGIVCTQTSAETLLDTLIQKADAALYRAKESGRNRVIRAIV